MADTLGKNVAGYVGWAALAVLIAILQEIHQQIEQFVVFDPWRVVDAAIVALLPVLIVMLGSMKQPQVGNEPLAAKADDHADNLEVTDPADPAPAWLPPAHRAPAPMAVPDPRPTRVRGIPDDPAFAGRSGN